MIIEERIVRSIARCKDDVFIRNEFSAIGSEAQVSRALRNLVSRGFIVKLGVGVYAKAKKSILSGAAIPVRPVGILGPIALRKLGVKTYPSQITRAYNSGESTQIPAGNIVNVGKRRINRKLGFGKQSITYETNNRPAITSY
jgi:hypothetical protein